MSCIICFDDITQFIECPDKGCDAKICFECGVDYISSSYPDSLPGCPLPTCDTVLMLSQVKKLGNKTLKKYLKILYTRLNGKEVEKIEAKADIIANIRRKRGKYIKEAFPPLVSLTIELCMHSKLKKLDAQIKAQTEERANRDIKKCFSVLCEGYLDEYMICSSCDKQWCRECEKEKKGQAHKCDPQDVASVNAMKDFVSCPKCGVKVCKSYGCNNMTCGLCKTNFNYLDGKKSGSGSEKVRMVTVKAGTIEKITKDADIHSMFYTLADKRPKRLKPDILYNLIVKRKEEYKIKDKKYKFLTDLAKKYEKVELNKLMAREFNKIMTAFEKAAFKSEKEECQEIFDKYK